MSKVNFVLELDEKIVDKLPTIETQLEKGTYMLVVDGSVHGSKVMSLIMTWMACNNDGVKSVVVAGGGNVMVESGGSQSHGRDFQSNGEVDHFMLFVVEQGISVVLELIEATIKLEIWPLFELASKMVSKLIKDMDIAEVRKLLQIEIGVGLSTGCIKGFLKYLPISQRLELDDIELKEWQLASNSIWSEQKVLYFGNTMPVKEKQCDHCNGIKLEANHVQCSKDELTENLESIKTSRRRRVPEKFLRVVRRCINLEVISWDSNFGQMADTKFARVLEQNCPHLVHIEGWIKKEFELKANGKSRLVQPGSFLDVFEANKNISCFLTKYDEEQNAEQKMKWDDELLVKGADDLNCTAELNVEMYEKIKLYATNVAVTKPLNLSGSWYLVDKVWFVKMKNLKTAMISKIDNSSLLHIINGEYELKEGLKDNEDYVLINGTGWKLLVHTFGLVSENQVIKRPVVYNLILNAYEVEVYQMVLTLSSLDKPMLYLNRKFSIAVKYDDLVEEMKQIFSIDEKNTTRLRLNFETVKRGDKNGFESTVLTLRYDKDSFGNTSCSSFHEPKYLKGGDNVTIEVIE